MEVNPLSRRGDSRGKDSADKSTCQDWAHIRLQQQLNGDCGLLQHNIRYRLNNASCPSTRASYLQECGSSHFLDPDRLCIAGGVLAPYDSKMCPIRLWSFQTFPGVPPDIHLARSAEHDELSALWLLQLELPGFWHWPRHAYWVVGFVLGHSLGSNHSLRHRFEALHEVMFSWDLAEEAQVLHQSSWAVALQHLHSIHDSGLHGPGFHIRHRLVR